MSDQVTCRKCGARNRVRATPGGLRPVCGRCGAPLVEEQPDVLNYEAPASPARSRAVENRNWIIGIVVVALGLTGVAELLLIMLR